MTVVLNRPQPETEARSHANRGDGPDFICVGAQKGGTQWLYDQLAFHPECRMPPIKELHVFDGARASFRRARRLLARIDDNLDKVNAKRLSGVGRPLSEADVRFVRRYVELFQNSRAFDNPARRIEAYARLFEEKGDRLTGDVTPGYSKLSAEDVARVASRFPEARVFFIAREPIERFWSSFCMAQRQDRDSVPKAVTPASVIAFAKRKTVTSRSYPSVIVDCWRTNLRADRFALFFFDDLRRDAAGLRGRILEFIGIDPNQRSGNLDPGFNRKSKSAKPELTDGIRDALVGHFADELVRCSETLGGPAVEWRRKYGV